MDTVARSIYITSAEGNTGKSTIALGVLDTLTHSVQRVGVFRPVARSSDEPDYVVELLLRHLQAGEPAGSPSAQNYEQSIGVTYDAVNRIVGDPDALLI